MIRVLAAMFLSIIGGIILAYFLFQYTTIDHYARGMAVGSLSMIIYFNVLMAGKKI